MQPLLVKSVLLRQKSNWQLPRINPSSAMLDFSTGMRTCIFKLDKLQRLTMSVCLSVCIGKCLLNERKHFPPFSLFFDRIRRLKSWNYAKILPRCLQKTCLKKQQERKKEPLWLVTQPIEMDQSESNYHKQLREKRDKCRYLRKFTFFLIKTPRSTVKIRNLSTEKWRHACILKRPFLNWAGENAPNDFRESKAR